MRAQQDEQL